MEILFALLVLVGVAFFFTAIAILIDEKIGSKNKYFDEYDEEDNLKEFWEKWERDKDWW